MNKRFTFTQDTLAKADVFDNEEFVCCTLSVWVEQLVDLLNKLHEENENLKNALWEAEANYYAERSEYDFEYEEWIEELKEDWDKEYWND